MRTGAFAPAAGPGTPAPAAGGTDAAFLRIEQLCKRYEGTGRGQTLALDRVSFSVPRGAFVTLLGPSGCGKSTLLNLIAGLDSPTAGRISIGGREVYDSARKLDLPAAARDISMVFQSYAIWPHMTVRENVEFPLKHGKQARSLPAAERRARVEHALDKVRLGAFADRPAPLLSGGQQQRVSLARALAQRPSIILLDEPLSNLDANLREHMQKEIRSLVTDEGITAAYVTHDQKEALSMSDVIVLMKDGVVQQVGSPQDIYYRPTNRFVAQFMGWPNLVPAQVCERSPCGQRMAVVSPLGTLQVALGPHLPEPAVGTRLELVLKQEDIRILEPAEAAGSANVFELPLVREVFHGDRLEVMCRSGDLAIAVYTNARRCQGNGPVRLACDPRHIHYLSAEGDGAAVVARAAVSDRCEVTA